jgi:hypothetical protein
MSTLLVVERDTLCIKTLLVVERDKHWTYMHGGGWHCLRLIKNISILSESHHIETKPTEKCSVVLALLDFFSEHI